MLGADGHAVITDALTEARVHLHVAELLVPFATKPRFALSLVELMRDASWGSEQLPAVKVQRAALFELLRNADFLGLMRKLNDNSEAALSEQEAMLLGRYQRIQQAVNRLQLAQAAAVDPHADAMHRGPRTYYSERQVQLALGDTVTPVGNIGDKSFVIIPPCQDDSGINFADALKRIIEANPGKAFKVAAAVREGGNHWVVKCATVGRLGYDAVTGVTALHTYNSIGSGRSAASAADTASRLAGVSVLPGMQEITDRTNTQHDGDSCGARAVGRLLDMYDVAHGRPSQSRDQGDRATIRDWMDERAGIAAPAAGGDDSSSSPSGTGATADLLAYDTGYGIKYVTRATQELWDARLMHEWGSKPDATLEEIKRDVFKSLAPAGVQASSGNPRPFQAAAAMRTGLSPAEAAALRGP